MNPNAENEFLNPQVSFKGIPDYGNVQFEPVAGKFRRYTLISTLCYSVPIALAITGGWAFQLIPLEGWWILAAATGLLLWTSLIGVYRWLDASYRGWALRDHDIVARIGVLWRSTMALPLARIQHVETSHGPLERAHGLARLKLYTAGGLTADLTLIGLEGDTADRLREYLVEQIRKRDAKSLQALDE